jgi:hypothetical protein
LTSHWRSTLQVVLVPSPGPHHVFIPAVLCRQSYFPIWNAFEQLRRARTIHSFLRLNPFLILFSILHIFGDLLWFQGVLLGTLLRSRECVGISGGCASMRNAPLSPRSRYMTQAALFLLFSFILRAVGLICLSLLSFCSL